MFDPESILLKHWVGGQKKAIVKLPVTTTVPVKCAGRLTYKIGIPIELKGVVDVTAGGDIEVGGIVVPELAKVWGIKIQAVSPEGIVIGGTTVFWELELHVPKIGLSPIPPSVVS